MRQVASSSSSSASVPIATTVPIVSKKSASSSEKTNMIAVTKPSFSNDPSRLNWPRIPRSGVFVIDSGSAGTVSDQASGFCSPWSVKIRGPIWKAASMMMASTVAAAMPSRMAPLTLRMSSTVMRKTPKTKTSVGQPLRLPPMPARSGRSPATSGGARSRRR